MNILRTLRVALIKLTKLRTKELGSFSAVSKVIKICELKNK